MPQKERETDGARRQSSETEPKYSVSEDLDQGLDVDACPRSPVRYFVPSHGKECFNLTLFRLKKHPPPREGKYSPRISGSKTKCYKLQISGNAWSICRTMSEAKGSPRVASQPQRKRKNLTEKAIWSQYGHSVRSMGVVGVNAV
jgi:hypothetical protein